VRHIAAWPTAAPCAAASQARNSATVALGRRATSARMASWCGASRGATRLRCGRADVSPASRRRARALTT
jgi:hypothetical protein